MNCSKTVFTSIAILFVLNAIVGQEEDHNWLFGFALGDNVDPSVKLDTNWGATNIDFNFDPPKVYYDSCRVLDFSGANTSMSDKSGGLLFYSNSQILVDGKNEVIEDTINFGTHWIVNYPNIGGQRVPAGLPFAQSILSLPKPGSDNIYYVFYMLWEEIENYTFIFRYAIIDHVKESDSFMVLEKDKILLQDSLMNNGLTACKHANGRDWWIIVTNRTTSMANVFLFADSSVDLMHTISLPTSYPGAIGWKYFSPNGQYYAINDGYSFTSDNIFSLYEFNREDGLLSNIMVDSFPSDFLGSSLSFSPDNSKLYANTSNLVYQYDLKAEDVKSSRVIVAEYDGFLSYSPGGNVGQKTTFGPSGIGPDGKIYMSAGSGSNRYLHVINKPNERGESCDLRQHSIKLPTSYAFTMPNFPNFRLGPIDGSESDSLGIDNHPVAKFRYEQNSSDYLEIDFVNLSFYEPEDFIWDFGDGIISLDENPTHVFSSSGIYEVCLTSTNENSSNTSCQTLEIGTVGTSTFDKSKVDLHIFPNPARDYIDLTIENYLPKDAVAKLFTMSGELVNSYSIRGGRNQIDLEDLPSGIYIVKVEDSGTLLKAEKVIITK